MADTTYTYYSLSDVPATERGVWGLLRQDGPVVERFFPGFGWLESPSAHSYIFEGEAGASELDPDHAAALQASDRLVKLDESAVRYLTTMESVRGTTSEGETAE